MALTVQIIYLKRMSARQWTRDEEAQLRRLVETRPKLSASEMGRRMGRSRGSVIGYCKRIGLALPKAAVPRFAELTAHQCRFPVADDQPGPLMACCGRTVAEPHAATGMSASYCATCLKTMTNA